MKKILVLLAMMLPVVGFSQDEDLRYYDFVYMDNLKSVKFHAEGLLLSLPIIELGGNVGVVLSFDDLSRDYKDYTYSVVHCNANWEPSNLTEFEYIDGFSEERIERYDYSFKVKTTYTHYQMTVPNEDLRLLVSGNYLLKVYEDEDEKRLAITRRFMVVDMKVDIIPDIVRPARVDKISTHQEFDFTVSHKRFEIRNPQQEITAVVLQNGRWDNAITGLKPLFSRLGEQVFDFQDKIVFPAGKEFRYLDLRGIRYPSPRIVSVVESNGKYEVTLEREQKRGSMPYFEWNDINGNFIIENNDERSRIYANQSATAGEFVTRLTEAEEQDFNARLARSQSSEQSAAIRNERQQLLNQRQQEVTDRERQLFGDDSFAEDVHNLQSEYADVLFQLYSPSEMYEQDIYIFGGLSDWQLKPEFRMTWNPLINSYVAKVNLKQGYYNYLYAALPRGAEVPDFEETEGNWHETDNNYTVLVYYRPFGGRYDQLIGAYSFSSRD
ncbi:MAG: DUF5103 domain-containing protein [Bacteroidetes bacterium]|nr:DUF5103 domain-containing protein [Bacteroidota bacterium]